MRRFVELMWLALAAITAVEAYFAYQDSGFTQRTYMMLAVFGLSIFMYYLRKKQRVKAQIRARKRSSEELRS